MDNRPFRTTRRLQNFGSGQKLDWYRITNKSSSPVRVDIFDEIGYMGQTAQDFIRDISGVSGDVDLHISSPGGDIFEGVAIYNSLKQRKGTVSVVVDGLAASAASFIAQAASPGQLKMAPHSQLMIHEGYAAAIGDSNDMRKMADLLDKASDNIASIYAERSGKPADYWRSAMRSETWYSDAEAVSAGLADGILGQDPPQNTWDLSVYNSAVPDAKPKKKKLQNAKYNTDDRKRMASAGQAMEDGSYPIADAEDLDNAIHAVGRGGADHDSIRAHIIKRADALGLSSRIPDNWNSDGSLKAAENLSDFELMTKVLIDALIKEAK